MLFCVLLYYCCCFMDTCYANLQLRCFAIQCLCCGRGMRQIHFMNSIKCRRFFWMLSSTCNIIAKHCYRQYLHSLYFTIVVQQFKIYILFYVSERWLCFTLIQSAILNYTIQYNYSVLCLFTVDYAIKSAWTLIHYMLYVC